MGSSVPPITNPMSSPSAWADAGFTIALSPKTPAPAVVTSPKLSQRSLRPDICDLPTLGVLARAGCCPSSAGIQRMFYSSFASVSKKYTGFPSAKLSTCYPQPQGVHQPHKPQPPRQSLPGGVIVFCNLTARVISTPAVISHTTSLPNTR